MYLHDYRVHVVEIELCIGGETTVQDFSKEPKTKVLDENLTSVESVESLLTRK